ncbi:unnamed protein product [Nippostrongylus brasiliensis]|uniref:Methyltransferase-like protein 13 n=1 Tax=Nippostrongylus brasiliensis TaxID=27835 RepID=A0A0N4YHJ6_NIPBR|nr:unnamed protein product [Nippostrongylus brasiliensis]
MARGRSEHIHAEKNLPESPKFYVLLEDNIVIDKRYESAVNEAILKDRVDFHEMAIANMCSNTTARCYSVYDRKLSLDGEEEVVERHLMVDGFHADSDTVVRLIAPPGETFETSDTRMWQIKHSELCFQYSAAVLAAPFLLTSLPLDTDLKGRKWLEIGLGGGSLGMALHLLKPELEITEVEIDPAVLHIAKEWFGVKESKNHRIVVDDGFKFVEEAVKTGEKYDVIILDACDESIVSPCPAKAMRSKEFALTLKSALMSTGTLVVNILSGDIEGAGSSSGEIASQFTSVFPACLQMKMSSELNIVLACVPYTIANIRHQLSFYNSRMGRIGSQFNLTNVLDNVSIV